VHYHTVSKGIKRVVSEKKTDKKDLIPWIECCSKRYQAFFAEINHSQYFFRYASYTNQFAFIAGGWGIAAFTFGIGRIWASYKFEFYWFMVILGLLEGVILSLYCMINVFFLEISLLQVMLPLSVGSVYGVFYFIALLFLLRLDKSN